MLKVMRRFKWGEFDLDFTPDEDMRKIEKRLSVYGKVTHVNYANGRIELQVSSENADYFAKCLRRMRFKKPSTDAVRGSEEASP